MLQLQSRDRHSYTVLGSIFTSSGLRNILKHGIHTDNILAYVYNLPPGQTIGRSQTDCLI